MWSSSNTAQLFLTALSFSIGRLLASLAVALIEYAYVMAHLLFCATMLFDFYGLELLTTTADVLFIDPYFNDVYEPNDLVAKRNSELMWRRITANIGMK